MQNRFHAFGPRGFPEHSEKISTMFLILGIASAVVPMFGLILYLRHTPAKNVLLEIPILLVLSAVFLINVSLLHYSGGSSSAEARKQNILVTILVWTTVIYFFNNILPCINWRTLSWQPARIVPSEELAGLDFKSGLYDPAKEIAEGSGVYYMGYAPVVTLLVLPLTYFTLWRAYIIFLTLLCITNVATVLGANLLAGAISGKDHGFSWEIAGMISMYTLTSYGIFFGLKTGNFDVFVSFFAVLGLLFLVRFPEKIWLSTFFLSLAAHMKLYPGILFAILLWKYGRKSILPLLVINIGLFLVLGIKPVMEFLVRLGPYSLDPFISVKNSSAASFAAHLILQGIPLDRDLLTGILISIPFLIWLGSAFYLYKKGFSNLGVLWLFAISFAPMFALPSVSHDYKLVILSAPLLLVLYRLARIYTQTGSTSVAVIVMAFMVTALFIHRSVFDSSILFLQNKYCSILAFQILSACGMLMDFSSQNTDM